MIGWQCRVHGWQTWQLGKQSAFFLLEDFPFSGQWTHDDIWRQRSLILCRTLMTLSLRYPLHMLQCNGFTDAIVVVQVKILSLPTYFVMKIMSLQHILLWTVNTFAKICCRTRQKRKWQGFQRNMGFPLNLRFGPVLSLCSNFSHKNNLTHVSCHVFWCHL